MDICKFAFFLNLECVTVKKLLQLECKNLLMAKLTLYNDLSRVVSQLLANVLTFAKVRPVVWPWLLLTELAKRANSNTVKQV